VAESNVLARDEILKRVSSNDDISLVMYKHGLRLLVTNPEDQLLLQQTGMMSGRHIIFFNHLPVKMMGISIHITSTTLVALKDKQMSD
jgi:hypothetical protein